MASSKLQELLDELDRKDRDNISVEEENDDLSRLVVCLSEELTDTCKMYSELVEENRKLMERIVDYELLLDELEQNESIAREYEPQFRRLHRKGTAKIGKVEVGYDVGQTGFRIGFDFPKKK